MLLVFFFLSNPLVQQIPEQYFGTVRERQRPRETDRQRETERDRKRETHIQRDRQRHR